MSTTTTNYNLIKPELTDAADITATNENWDTIDTELKNRLPLSGGSVSGYIKIPISSSGGLTDINDKNLFYANSSGIQIGGTTNSGEGYAGETSINSVDGLRVRNAGIMANGTLTIATGGAKISGDVAIDGSLGGIKGLTVSSGGANITGRTDVNGHLYVGGEGTSYAVTATGNINAGGYIKATGTSEQSKSANVYYNASNGVFYIAGGSSSRYKRDIEDLPSEKAEKSIRP